MLTKIDSEVRFIDSQFVILFTVSYLDSQFDKSILSSLNRLEGPYTGF